MLTWLHLYGWLVLLLTTVRDQDDWTEIFKAMVISGTLQTAYALGELFNLGFAIDTSGTRVSGAIGNPSFLAPYLMAIITCAVIVLLRSTSKLWRTLSSLLIALDLLLIWETQTRGAILGSILAAILICAIMLWKRYRLKGAAVGALLLILLTSGAVIALQSFKYSSWMTKMPTLERLASISANDITTQNRFIVWGAGLQGFLARPIFGWGWENFSEPFNIYFNPALTRDIGSHPWYDRAHNTVLEVAVATGIVGLLIYLALWYVTIGMLWSKKTALSQGERYALTWFFIAYFIQNLFVFDTLNSYAVWILLLVFLQHHKPRSAKQQRSHRAAPSLKVVLPALSVLLLLALYYANIRPVLANYYTVQAAIRSKGKPDQAQSYFSQAFEYSPPTEEEPRFILAQYTRDTINTYGITPATQPLITFAVTELQKTIDVHASSIQTYLLLSEVYLAADSVDPNYIHNAESVALEALARAPRRYQTYTLLGRIKAEENDLPAAIQYLTQAVELNDQFAEAHWNLAIAYILSHEQAQANTELDRVEALGFPIYTDANIHKLVSAYTDARDLGAIIAFMDRVIAHVPDNPQYQQLSTDLKAVRDKALKAMQGTTTH